MSVKSVVANVRQQDNIQTLLGTEPVHMSWILYRGWVGWVGGVSVETVTKIGSREGVLSLTRHSICQCSTDRQRSMTAKRSTYLIVGVGSMEGHTRTDERTDLT